MGRMRMRPSVTLADLARRSVGASGLCYPLALYTRALVAKSVDAPDSKSGSARSVGSSPTWGTTIRCQSLLDRMSREREMSYPTLEDAIGKTPLVRLQRVPGADNDARGNVILAKL